MRAALLLLVPPTRAADGVDLLLGPTRVRVEAGSTAEWSKFLDALFTYFDRDGNGSLSAAEVARIFPLPAAKPIPPDFARMDADGDKKVTRAEFADFYHKAGFTPAIGRVVPAGPDRLAAGEVLFRRLDTNGDGKLTAAELAAAPKLLARLDADEDGALTVAEILAAGRHEVLAKASPVRFETLDPKVAAAQVLRDGATALAWPEGSGTFARRTDLDARLAATRAYYLSAFRAALGSRPAVAWKDVEDDPAHQIVAVLFPVADRDGDGRLTPAEMEGFLNLIEAGARAVTTVTLADRGRSLFDVLDADGDGRLTARELQSAATRVGAADRPVARDRVRWRADVTVAIGPPGDGFGPVRFAAPKQVAAADRPTSAAGPRWFRAMDRNGDGLVSAAEFIGPPEAFAKLDTNGDGFIDLAEASRERK